MDFNKVLGLLVFLISSFGHAGVGTPPAAANACIGCHGPAGVSASPLWPNLAGQKEGYLLKQLNDFRNGQRKDPLMSPISLSLSDQDISDLAKYFASLK